MWKFPFKIWNILQIFRISVLYLIFLLTRLENLVEESNQAKASLTKPWLAVDEADRYLVVWEQSPDISRLWFLDLFPHFHDFWSQIGVVILVTPKQEGERKSECFCRVKFLLFFSIFWIGFFSKCFSQSIHGSF